MIIREVNLAVDSAQLLKLSKRLNDFDVPQRIDADFFARVQMANFEADLADLEKDSFILVAVGEQDESGVVAGGEGDAEDGGAILGFVQVEVQKDWISKQRHGYISRIVVAKEAEGAGVAKQLMAAVEEWSQQQGYPIITLSVFAANQHAIGFYEHLGYEVETVKMVKSADD